MNLINQIKQDIFPIFQALIPESSPQTMRLTLSDSKQIGDYQLNGFIADPALNKDRTRREELICEFLSKVDGKKFPWLAAASATPAGFINFSLCEKWLFDRLNKSQKILMPAADLDRIVLDYSAPNIAKEMAVHHMRSTFIGDAMGRIFEALGHALIRANHIGDWGTQFGLLLAWIKEHSIDLDACSLGDLEAIYTQAQAKKSEDEAFAERARAEVVALQQGDPLCLAQWEKLVALSMNRNYEIYDSLNVKLGPKDTYGESSYNPQLAPLIEELLEKKIAVRQEKMVIVFSEQFKNKEQEPLAIILQKSGGGFLYATTDLAALHYRVETLKATRIIYCVDARQAQHFELVWEVARRAGYLPEPVKVEHHAFGMMLGSNARPYKTRSGATPKLMEFVQEAHQHVAQFLKARPMEHLSASAQEELIHALAINSIKYADLMRHRATNYKFSWEEALSIEGNSAPYLMYALVRAKSILRKSETRKAKLTISESSNPLIFGFDLISRALLLQLLRWQEVVEKASEDGTPHLLCQHLYQLSLTFSSFYERHPILLEEDEQKFFVRLCLTERLAQLLAQGLDLLGLIPVEQM